MANIIWISILLLKVLAIVLLFLFAVVSFLLLILLIVPVKYSVVGEYKETLETMVISTRAKWFGKILYLELTYDQGEIKQLARFWGMDITSLLKKDERKDELEIDEDINNIPAAEEIKESSVEIESEINEIEESLKNESGDNSLYNRLKVYRNKFKKVIKQMKKLKWNFAKICDMIKRVWKVKEKLQIIFERPIHKKTLDNLKKEGIYLYRKIKPKRVTIIGDIGLEDPSDTGKLMAVLGIMLPFIGEYDIEVQPEFHKRIIWIEWVISGELYLKHVLKVLINLVKVKGNRYTIKIIKRLNI